MPSDTLFYRLFNPGIPLGVFLAVLSLSVLTSCIIMCKRQREKNKLGLMVWIVAYILLMLYSTVLGREAGSSVSIHLTPFWSIGAIQEGYIETLYEKIYNVIFFVPYGMLLAAYRRFKGIKEFKWVRISVLIGCLTSVSIELLQFITRTGTCETDDVICNTVGCAIGAMIGTTLYKLSEIIKLKRS